jgi:hypothetical protein
MKFKDMTTINNPDFKIFEDGMKVRECVSDLLSAIMDAEESEQSIQIDYAIAELKKLKAELNG